jgi:hypothetical protein
MWNYNNNILSILYGVANMRLFSEILEFTFGLSEYDMATGNTLSVHDDENNNNNNMIITNFEKPIVLIFSKPIDLRTINFNISQTLHLLYNVIIFLATCFDRFQSSSGPAKNKSNAYLMLPVGKL